MTELLLMLANSMLFDKVINHMKAAPSKENKDSINSIAMMIMAKEYIENSGGIDKAMAAVKTKNSFLNPEEDKKNYRRF